MRVLSLFIAILIVIAVVIFALQNSTTQVMSFLGFNFRSNAGLIAVAAAILGLILGFVLLIPGRVAAGWRGMGLRRDYSRLEEEMNALHAQHAQLQQDHHQLQIEREQLAAENQQVTSERDWLRRQAATMATTTPTATPATSAATAMPTAGTPGAETPVATTPTVTSNVTPVVPSPVAPPSTQRGEARADSAPTGPIGADDATASPDGENPQPSLADRVRDFFHPSDSSEEAQRDENAMPEQQNWPQGPAAPTT